MESSRSLILFTETDCPFPSVVIYLCADNADMPEIPVHPKNRTRSNGLVDPAVKPKVWKVGERAGCLINKQRNQTQGNQLKKEQSFWHYSYEELQTGKKNLHVQWVSPYN